MRIYPIGYRLTESGRTVGVIFGVFSVLLAGAMLIMEGGIIQALPFIIIAVMFFAGGFISDYTVNKKARPKIAHMEEMLTLTEVSGEITGTEKKAIFFGKELDTTEGYKAKNIICRFRVKYTDPFSGEEREALSESYSYLSLMEKPEGRFRLKPCYDQERVRVYTDGERVWTELIYKKPEAEDEES
ncbi:MAG: hypothetical protein IKP95_05440 [Ruminococcus sp.]|nr:hypothetical protein [Ruminococcus sp.]